MNDPQGRGQEKMAKPNPAADTEATGEVPPGETRKQKTDPAEEWGQRHSTTNTIQQGGQGDADHREPAKEKS